MSGIRHDLSEITDYLRQCNRSHEGLFPSNNSPVFDGHIGLWFDKYFGGDSYDTSEAGKSARGEFVAEVASLPGSPLYPRFFERWRTSLPDASFYRGKCSGRVTLGLGNASVIETGCTLHHTYGVPYFPGSALKGVAARYARTALGAKDASWKRSGANYEELFGSHDELFDLQEAGAARNDRAGCVDFLDALPTLSGDAKQRRGNFSLLVDVMAVHHKDFYNGGNAPVAAPSDRDQPILVPFLAFTGTFLLALRGPAAWCETAAEIAFAALRQEGAGAKTSSGYGRVEKLDTAEKRASAKRADRERASEQAVRQEEIRKEREEREAEIVRATHSRTVESALLNVATSRSEATVETDHDGEHPVLNVPADCEPEELVEVEIARDAVGSVLQVRFLRHL